MAIGAIITLMASKRASNDHDRAFMDALNASEEAWHAAMDNAGPLDALQASPLFNLSLGSKELFHSNFLAWLFESYPREFGKMLSRFLKDQSGNTTITKVERELKHRDLTISFANGQQLVIENKVKSLPYIEQLMEYSEGRESDQNFLLLSLVHPSFSLADTAWDAITYSDLATLLESTKGVVTNAYRAALLDDYILFIKAFSDLFSSNDVRGDEAFAAVVSSEGNGMVRKLRDLRIADIYQKLRCEALAVRLHAELSDLYPGHAHIAVPAEKRVLDDVYVGHGMTNSMGLIEACIVVAPGLFLTVQIQGMSYRHMVQSYVSKDGKLARRTAEHLFEKKLWFDFSSVGKGLKEYPRGEKGFNTYSRLDYYRSVTIPDNMTVQEVLGAVVADVRRVVENRTVISAKIGS